MTNASAAPEHVTSQPPYEDPPLARAVEELGRQTRESTREALESTVARLRAAEEGSAEVPRDIGFACEWWPPD